MTRSPDLRYEHKGESYVWKRVKAELVRRQRGVTIAMAAQALSDEYGNAEADPDHDDRGHYTGMIGSGRLLLVVYVLVEEDGATRIITAYPATKEHWRAYIANLEPKGGPRRDPRRVASTRSAFERRFGHGARRVRTTEKKHRSPAMNVAPKLRAAGRVAATGARLRAYRQAWGWSQDQLAHRSGVDQAVISHIEGGRIGLGPRRAEKLASALGVSAAALLWSSYASRR